MKTRLDISVLLILSTLSLISDAAALKDIPYCFNFTWLGSAPEKNCSIIKNSPCIEPVMTEPLDTTVIWDNAVNGQELRVCELKPGQVCIRYTVFYDNAIVNTSSFCGKMTEDQSIPVTSGCYQQSVDGHTIEACACRSNTGKMPCNTSTKTEYFTIILFLGLSITAVNYIKSIKV